MKITLLKKSRERRGDIVWIKRWREGHTHTHTHTHTHLLYQFATKLLHHPRHRNLLPSIPPMFLLAGGLLVEVRTVQPALSPQPPLRSHPIISCRPRGGRGNNISGASPAATQLAISCVYA
ncbi:hypothetical protein E2C01_093996 [Portunus trituberculatus]|uniref:Uncharacterized protein n=1 Tax=Portunus trituberculatus TaxID=210409 RepID=A0A5B7JRC2_PORTR|nr:hypothetical protein [Portunus trituberculatus]